MDLDEHCYANHQLLHLVLTLAPPQHLHANRELFLVVSLPHSKPHH
jgi:hypothetical protein